MICSEYPLNTPWTNIVHFPVSIVCADMKPSTAQIMPKLTVLTQCEFRVENSHQGRNASHLYHSKDARERLQP